MLGSGDLVGFVPTADLDRASGFFGEVLGLEQVGVSPIACVFDANGTALRVTLVGEFSPAPFTVLGWSVTGLDDLVRSLRDRGVVFERFGGMDQDELGIWTAAGGDRVAWFKDPDGNTLSLTEEGGMSGDR